MLEPVGSQTPAPRHVSWSSAALPERQRYDAWASVLSDYFLPWSITSTSRQSHLASVRQTDIGSCRFIHCRSDPLSGVRTQAEISRTPGDFFNVLYVVSGVEFLRFHDRELVLKAGECVVWDSRRRIEFSLGAPLEKLTLMVPSGLVRSLLPNISDYVGIPLQASQGIGGLFAHHLLGLGHRIWNMNERDAQQILSPTLDLLARSLSAVPCRRRPTMRQSSLQRVREFIVANLSDPDLSTARIAAANHLSVRYLHLLFSGIDTTVSDWIRAQRLERCRHDLLNVQLAHQSITQIALRWGFADSSNFGKVFRKAYGESPRSSRHRLGR